MEVKPGNKQTEIGMIPPGSVTTTTSSPVSLCRFSSRVESDDIVLASRMLAASVTQPVRSGVERATAALAARRDAIKG